MVKRLCRAVMLLVAAVIALVGFSGPASAQTAYAPPQVYFVSPVVVSHSGTDAYVIAAYKCYGGSAGTHLWVSVKQGPQINATDHTSSQYAQGWYDTNWNYGMSPAGLLANCNGRLQIARIDLKPEFGTLHSGVGFVQFCLFDSTAPPNDENPSTGFAFNYSMQHIFAG